MIIFSTVPGRMALGFSFIVSSEREFVGLDYTRTFEKDVLPLLRRQNGFKEGADHLYREIRIDNTMTRENGDEVSLKPGAQVEVTVEAEAEATTPKK